MVKVPVEVAVEVASSSHLFTSFAFYSFSNKPVMSCLWLPRATTPGNNLPPRLVLRTRVPPPSPCYEPRVDQVLSWWFLHATPGACLVTSSSWTIPAASMELISIGSLLIRKLTLFSSCTHVSSGILLCMHLFAMCASFCNVFIFHVNLNCMYSCISMNLTCFCNTLCHRVIK